MDAIKQLWAWLEPLQRRRALGAAVALTFLAGALLGGIFGDEDGEANANTTPHSGGPHSGGMPNALSVLASRSPGARPDGALYQTKPRLAAASRRRPAPRVFLPSERVLSTGRIRPLAFAAPPGGQEPAFGLQGLPVEFMTVPGLTPPSPGLAFEVPAFAFGEAPLSAGTPGVPGTLPAPSTPVTPEPLGTPPQNPVSAIPGSPAPAVPEPAIWLLMIAGLGMVGQVLRQSSARTPDVLGKSDLTALHRVLS